MSRWTMSWPPSIKPDLAGQPLRATLITVPNCHLCEHAHAVLTRVVQDRPLVIDELAWNSLEGRALVERDGIPFAPAVYIDGVFCAYGRLSEGALRSWLKARTVK